MKRRWPVVDPMRYLLVQRAVGAVGQISGAVGQSLAACRSRGMRGAQSRHGVMANLA